jgi:hypothetical protein
LASDRPAAKRGDAAVGRLKELAGVAQRVTQRLVRFADVSQVGGQAVDELEGGEFALDRMHGASGWFPTPRAVKSDHLHTVKRSSDEP